MADTVSIDEQTFGPSADSYAQKYGIPTDVFRDVIRSVSNFNPEQSNSGGQGIANLNTSAATVDPSMIGDSLDFAAKYLKSQYDQLGSWSDAANQYPGYSNSAAKSNSSSSDNSMSGADGAGQVDDSITGQIISFFKASGYTILIVAVGLVLVLGSTWVLINSTKDK